MAGISPGSRLLLCFSFAVLFSALILCSGFGPHFPVSPSGSHSRLVQYILIFAPPLGLVEGLVRVGKEDTAVPAIVRIIGGADAGGYEICLLYTSDAADE